MAALQKWEGIINFQSVEVWTDHQALRHWVTEHVETPSGPRGRRARWHQILSRFDITIQYIPGPENLVADAMSRWAYPAGGERDEVSVHGSLESCLKVRQMQEQAFLERECRRVSFQGELSKPKALDLFSGTGSVSTVLKEFGYQVVSLDFQPSMERI